MCHNQDHKTAATLHLMQLSGSTVHTLHDSADRTISAKARYLHIIILVKCVASAFNYVVAGSKSHKQQSCSRVMVLHAFK